MQLHRILTLTAALLITAALSSCSSTSGSRSGTENTSGAYVAPKDSQWYQAKGGVLYAWDGQHWYALRQAENNAGYISGTNVGGPECWQRVDGGNTQCYARTPATFRDSKLQPVFIAY